MQDICSELEQMIHTVMYDISVAQKMIGRNVMPPSLPSFELTTKGLVVTIKTSYTHTLLDVRRQHLEYFIKQHKQYYPHPLTDVLTKYYKSKYSIVAVMIDYVAMGTAVEKGLFCERGRRLAKALVEIGWKPKQ